MDNSSHSHRSHLFTVRVWQEEIGTDKTEWLGKVQLVTSGEVRYFREWAALAPLLATIPGCQSWITSLLHHPLGNEPGGHRPLQR